MKKLLPGILALLLAFGGLTACTPTDPESTPSGSTPPASTSDSTPGQTAHPHETDLKDVKDYLLEQLAKKDLSTYKDFTVPSSFNFIGDTAIYDIVWTSNVAAVTIEAGETEDTVKIGEVSEDTPFVLTATVTDPEGCHTTTFTVDGVAERAPQIVPNAISAAPSEETVYKLYMYQITKAQDLYFTGKMSGFYLATTNVSQGQTYEDGVDVYVKAVTGKAGYFNLTYTDPENGKTMYIGVLNYYNNGKWRDNVVLAESNVPTAGNNETFEFTYSEQYGTMVATLSGVKSGSDEATTETKTDSFWLGTDGTYYTIGAMSVSKITKSDACVGKLVEMVDKSTIVVPASKKVADVKASLNVGTKYTLDKEVTLKTSDSNYEDVTITWSVAENTAATVNGNKLNLVIPAEKTTVVLTATITCGETTDTKEFTLELGPKTVAPDKTDSAAIVAAAYNLVSGETLPGGNYTLTGEITTVNSAWSDQYSNITVTITIGDKTFECYRLASGDADASTLKVGDTITVTGAIKNYNGKVEFDQGCVLDAVVAGEGGTETPDPSTPTPEDIVNAAYALEKGAALEGTQTLTGVITNIDSAYNAQYSNVSVVIVVGNMTDKPILCYRMKGTGADTIGVADVITVTGTLKNYNGTIEFDAGCTFVLVSSHTCEAWDEATCQVPETCPVCGDVKAGSTTVDHVYVSGVCKWCSAPEGVATITASKTMAELITANGWTDTTTKQSFNLDDVVSVQVNGGSNTGKAYNGDHIRIYATDSPAGTLTISVAAGYELVSVKISTQTGTYAFLYVDGTTTDICNQTVAVSGTSVLLNSVKNGSNGKQVRITEIEVVYKATTPAA